VAEGPITTFLRRRRRTGQKENGGEGDEKGEKRAEREKGKKEKEMRRNENTRAMQ